MDNEQLIPVGSIVKIKMADIKGFVVSVGMDNPNAISYQVSYFIGTEHKISWFRSFEVNEHIDDSKPVGFGNFKENNQVLIE